MGWGRLRDRTQCSYNARNNKNERMNEALLNSPYIQPKQSVWFKALTEPYGQYVRDVAIAVFVWQIPYINIYRKSVLLFMV